MRRLVVALGGNALLPPGGEGLDLRAQQRAIEATAPVLAAAARRDRVVVTHGNGPQVGLLALQAEADPTLPRVPLDVLDAESEGMVGYLLAQGLGHHLDPDTVVTVLTQVEVDPDDPGFRRPTKPIGPRYEATAGPALADRGWTLGADGDGVRRLVPSPDPVRIVELEAVRLLSDEGFTVICAGGGGIPVARDGHGGTVGVEAVIDKDLASARLAVDLDVDELVLVTDVDGVYEAWGRPDARRLGEVTAAEVDELDLAEGSMGPKVEAARRFVVATGRRARIGALHDLERLLAGEAGTTVTSASPHQARSRSTRANQSTVT